MPSRLGQRSSIALTHRKSCSFSSKRGSRCVPTLNCKEASCVFSFIILNPISSALCISFNGVLLNVNLTFTFMPLMYFVWKLKWNKIKVMAEDIANTARMLQWLTNSAHGLQQECNLFPNFTIQGVNHNFFINDWAVHLAYFIIWVFLTAV